MELMDEHEQGERVRAWLRDNGGAILGGIAIGLAGLFGWNWWNNSQMEHRLDAATQYQALVEAAESNNRDVFDSLLASLAEDYSNTPYAALAALQAAEQSLAAGDAEAATGQLDQAVSLSRDPALTALAQVRLARVQLAAGRHEQALSTLKALPQGVFVAPAEELRGDVLVAMGRKDEARGAFEAALAALDETSPGRLMVELKLTDIAGARAVTES